MVFALLPLLQVFAVIATNCPPHTSFGKMPEDGCEEGTDPNHLPRSKIEKWFTEVMFNVSLLIRIS